MVSVAHIASLLVEAARLADLGAVVQHGEAGQWDLAFDDERLVEATLLADSGLLVLETDLGIPATRDAAALYRLLLEYSYLWRETGGLHIALAPPESRAFLTYGVPAEGTDATLLAHVLGNFHAAATAWAQRLAQPDPQDSDLVAPAMFPGAIRV